MLIAARLIALLLLSVSILTSLTVAKWHYSHFSVADAISFRLPLEETPEMLLLGSSHTRLSYDVALLEKTSGKSAYALAFSGLDYYFMLPVVEFLINNEAVPDLLVIENYVVAASSAPRLQDKNLFLSAPPALKSSLLAALRGLNITNTQLFELVVTGKNQDIATAALVNPLIDRTFYKGTHAIALSGNIAVSRFNRIQPPATVATGGHPLQLQALSKLLTLLETSDINAVFVESPMPHVVEKEAKFSAAKRQLAAIIETAGFTYLDGASQFPTQDHQNFMDDDHLSGVGRGVFTQQVSVLLDSHIPANRD